MKNNFKKSYQVYFIDYGNTDRLPASELRIAKEEFIYIPPQAFQCRLKKVSPNLANDEKFRQIAEGRKMIIQLGNYNEKTLNFPPLCFFY